jgi:hypothetical protein
MSLTFDLSSVRDLFAKLQRDAAALEEEVTSDRLFNFVVTGYSLINWVEHDPTVPPAAKADPVVRALHDDQWLKVCGDLATACKHFKVDRRRLVTASTKSARGWGMGRFGKGGWGMGEESIEVLLNDGTSFKCLDLVKNVLTTWQTFFKYHGL